MHKCEECHCLSLEGEPGGDHHRTDCSKYNPKKSGHPRKEKSDA